MSTIGFIDKVADMKPGDHLFLLYETEKEHRAVIAPFLCHGLERNEKVIYIADNHSTESVLGYLRSEGLSVELFLKSGQLVRLDVDEACMSEGVFDPDRMIDLLREETKRTLDEGRSALRVTGEMTWVLKGLAGAERIIEYESKLHRFLPGSKCLAICQYDRRRFEPAILLDVLVFHPLAIIGRKILENIYYRPPEEFLDTDPAAAKLKNWIKNLDERNRLKEERQKNSDELCERIKKLNCLYGISTLLARADLSPGERLQDVIDSMPLGWQYPEIACARITLNGQECKTENFRETAWKQTSDIMAGEKRLGVLGVFYLEEKPVADDGPFLKQERTLLDEIAYKLGIFIEKVWSLEAQGESGENFRRIINGNADAIIIIDQEGKVRFLNPASLELFGRREEDLLGKPFGFPVVTGERSEISILGREGEAVSAEMRITETQWKGEAAYLATLRDISERNRIEELVSKSEQRYRAILENIEDGYYEVDLAGNYTFFNEALCKLRGYPREELMGLNNREYMDEEIAKRTYQQYNEVYITGRPVKGFEFEGIQKDGSRRYTESSISLMKDLEGKPIGFRGITRDITDRKRGEKARLLSFRILEMANRNRDLTSLFKEFVTEIRSYSGCEAVGLRLVDDQGNITCQAYEGFSRDFYESESPLSIKSGQCMCINIMNGMTDPKRPLYTEAGSFYTNGTSRFLATLSEEEKGWARMMYGAGYESVALVPIRVENRILGLLHLADPQENRVPVEMVAVMENIALQLGTAVQRIQAEKAREESEERFKTLFEHAPDAYFLHDLEGRFIDGNRAAEEITGYNKNKLIGNSFLGLELLGPDELKKAANLLQKSIRGSATGPDELILNRKGGKQIYVEIRTFPLNMKGRDIVLGIARDISERKSLEEQLFQSQKLEAVGRLTSGIAHDFNNLLTTIIGSAELAAMDTDRDDPLYELMQEIKEAGDRATGLIRQLLAFSRKQILQPEMMNLNHVISEIERMLQRVIGEDIALETRLCPDLKPVEADVAQVEQVIVNLAVNARDAMPTGGKLTIETANVELDEAYAHAHIAVKPGPYVMLAVSDTGKGMTKEVQAQIFEPFFTTKEKGKGTGLGLSTVYGIVKQSNGNIWVYSEPGKGATFKIYLPVAGKAALGEKRAKKEEAEDLGGTETVLVVEDDEPLRMMAVKALVKYGYTVLTAADGPEVLRMCAEHKDPIHLMVTDVIMPDMSGKELADRLKELRPSLKVLFMSGYTDNAIVHHGVLDQGIDFLQKPFTPEGLARKVREVLD